MPMSQNAVKYSSHRYAYHEDKLGEVVNQIFEEDIPGLVFHISTAESAPKNMLCDEKYIAAKELLALKGRGGQLSLSLHRRDWQVQQGGGDRASVDQECLYHRTHTGFQGSAQGGRKTGV